MLKFTGLKFTGLKFTGLTAVALGLTVAAAFAQTTPVNPSPLPPAPPEINKDNPPPPPPPPGQRGPERAEGGKDEWRMPPRGNRPPPPRGAYFNVRIGDARIDLKCADDEPMKACADLLLQIIDRANASADNRDSQRDYGRDRDSDRDHDRFERYDRR